ncbi:MAG: MerR family transcriptional regulator [Candidatus Melainabacteria bacterium]|nr:MerR family transcriptional regulator [Candidatus Melainabacteria bacterium]
MPSQNNKKNDSSELTIKETSSKLDLSESTVKKYLKDFDLKIEKGIGSKAVISNETFQALSEIAKLRANGLSIQEIKELKSQKPSKNILDELEESAEDKKEVALQSEDVSVLKEEDKLSVDEDVPLNGEAEENGKSVDETRLEKESESDESDSYTSSDGEQGEQRRRRGFNYRYVERQISNDSKRVSSFRRRLQNPNISVQERLFFEEALERRILFLNGWKHILRWVSKQ